MRNQNIKRIRSASFRTIRGRVGALSALAWAFAIKAHAATAGTLPGKSR